jgi:HEPN domain-containing protein
MTPEEPRRDEAARWLVQAGRDLNAARLLVGPEPSRPVFHRQQAAEEAAKALLAFHNAAFRKTHDLNELGRQRVELHPSLARLFRDASDLTGYAVVFRSLDAPREPDESEAVAALETAARRSVAPYSSGTPPTTGRSPKSSQLKTRVSAGTRAASA